MGGRLEGGDREWTNEVLTMWGYVGEIEGEDIILGEDEGSQTFIYPHLHFRLGINANNIVAVTVTTEVIMFCIIIEKNRPSYVLCVLLAFLIVSFLTINIVLVISTHCYLFVDIIFGF